MFLFNLWINAVVCWYCFWCWCWSLFRISNSEIDHIWSWVGKVCRGKMVYIHVQHNCCFAILKCASPYRWVYSLRFLNWICALPKNREEFKMDESWDDITERPRLHHRSWHHLSFEWPKFSILVSGAQNKLLSTKRPIVLSRQWF